METGLPGPARAAAEHAARSSYGRLLAYLAARTRDVAGAEDALAEAFAAALAQWPQGGVPPNPEAWLLTVARRRMNDQHRRRATAAAGADHTRMLMEEMAETRDMEGIGDQRLALMFACAHPAIERGVRAPLILQTVLGLDAAAIASAFLVAPSAMGQRLVRAKARIRQTGIPFAIPGREELPERLGAVLEAIYAAYAEGWADPAGADARRRNLAEEGIWLGRVVTELMPQAAEALGLLALMLYAESRRAARRDAQGNYVPLAAQDTRLWDAAMIEEAERLLGRAGRLGAIGRYQIEAAVQSAHAIRRTGVATDWHAIATLYGALAAHSGSPVAALNRAVALAEAEGTAAGLAALEAISGDPRLADYQPYWAARAELMARSGDRKGAAQAYERAIGLEADPAVRDFLQDRKALVQP